MPIGRSSPHSSRLNQTDAVDSTSQIAGRLTSLLSSITSARQRDIAALPKMHNVKSSLNNTTGRGSQKQASNTDPPVLLKHYVPPDTTDPVMDRLNLRYTASPRRKPRADGQPLSARNGSYHDQRLHTVDASLKAVHDETAALLTRHLPCISSTFPEVHEVTHANKTTEISALDDRITPQTIHALLFKGCSNESSWRLRRRHQQLTSGEVEKETLVTPTEALRLRISRLEPPFMDQATQAKVFECPRNEAGTSPREAYSIMKSPTAGAVFPKPPPGHCSSHLVAPPPSPSSVPATRHGHLTWHQKQYVALVPKLTEPYSCHSSVCAMSLTLSTAVGDDGQIVEQVVAHAASQRCLEGTSVLTAGEGDGSYTVWSSGTRTSKGSTHSTVFSALDAVLSVSREYEKFMQKMYHVGAVETSSTRCAISDRITSFKSSRIPRKLWVTVRHPTMPSTRSMDGQGDEGSDADAYPSEKTLVFPAANATGRAQVYLLADALDRMFQEAPESLEVLADKSIAQLVLPELPESKQGAMRDALHVERMLSADAIRESEAAHTKYAKAVERMMEIIDVGLTEIVRQTGSLCVERGALLDALRIVVKDVTSSVLWLLNHCKERTREEARACRDLIIASQKDVEEVFKLREELRRMRREMDKLLEANSEFTEKASKYDTLMERLRLREGGILKHPGEKHLALLMEMEEECTASTRKGLEELYRYDTTDVGEGRVSDAPYTKMAQIKEREEREANEGLYVESYRLLAALGEAMQSVENVCRPLYDHVPFPKTASTANVASTKWATIAHAVGALEREKKHRKRVVDVFAWWNSMVEGDSSKDPTPSKQLVDQEADAKASAAEGEFAHETQGDLLPSPSSTSDLEENDSVVESESPVPDSLIAKAIPKKRLVRPITQKDLTDVGIYDCTPEEINMLYEIDVDMATYLKPQFVSPEVGQLNNATIRDMLHDVVNSLSHIKLRMEAIASHQVLEEGLKPPPLPPLYPEEPCSLCGRRDRAAIDRQSRSKALQRMASEIQRRYEATVLKCQRAEAEREELRKELVRLQAREAQLLHDHDLREEELLRANAELSDENKRVKRKNSTLSRGNEKRRNSVIFTPSGRTDI
ncbi:hypothetical protein ERJ75_000997700 [Trypanosoma vivax]|nr:hypothetical protein ERJ75_000997700 [Trypanosoma vivax]